jgi:hypothetical protein
LLPCPRFSRASLFPQGLVEHRLKLGASKPTFGGDLLVRGAGSLLAFASCLLELVLAAAGGSQPTSSSGELTRDDPPATSVCNGQIELVAVAAFWL